MQLTKIHRYKAVQISNKWSDRLIAETRAALENGVVTPLGVLHMKNLNGRYGKIQFDDLVAGRLHIKDKKSEAEYLYASADELIAAGWAID